MNQMKQKCSGDSETSKSNAGRSTLSRSTTYYQKLLFPPGKWEKIERVGRKIVRTIVDFTEVPKKHIL